MTPVKILGITDEVTTCGCCGRNGLKKTIALEIEEVLTHYGTTCATKALRFGNGGKFTATKLTAEANIAAVGSFYAYTAPYLSHHKMTPEQAIEVKKHRNAVLEAISFTTMGTSERRVSRKLMPYGTWDMIDVPMETWYFFRGIVFEKATV